MIKERYFIYPHKNFPSVHAPTIAQTEDGLVASFFAGSHEGARDVSIWLSKKENQNWSDPIQVAEGVAPDGSQFPCWNPVLFQPVHGPLLLFYKVGPYCSRWWGMITRSEDCGKTWQVPERLPEDIWGPIKNKPLQLNDGRLLCPSSTEHDGWKVHLEYTEDFGQTWQRTISLNDRKEFEAIQPTILTHSSEKLQILCRTREGWIATCWSEDGGSTWSKMEATDLPNPNSGIDALTLEDGRFLLVYNHVKIGNHAWGGPRTPLNVGISEDGIKWQSALVLENDEGEYSYPAVIQSSDGMVHILYTWKRERIRHTIIDPDKF